VKLQLTIFDVFDLLKYLLPQTDLRWPLLNALLFSEVVFPVMSRLLYDVCMVI